MSKIILASQSPRRRELLAAMGVTFTVQPSAYDEKLDDSKPAQEVAKELALGKALDVAAKFPSAYVIGSDTIVALGPRQMEKPADVDDAREMLTALAARGESLVTTGVAVVCRDAGVRLVDEVTTAVFFKPDSPEVAALREAYLASGDWRDKAGGYGIQSGARPLIERIQGDYDTIVGLPKARLREMLNQLGLVD